jgi:hypothetical protein
LFFLPTVARRKDSVVAGFGGAKPGSIPAGLLVVTPAPPNPSVSTEKMADILYSSSLSLFSMFLPTDPRSEDGVVTATGADGLLAAAKEPTHIKKISLYFNL